MYTNCIESSLRVPWRNVPYINKKTVKQETSSTSRFTDTKHKKYKNRSD